MSAVTDTVLDSLKSNPIQRAKIRVSPIEGSEFYLTEKQIIQNSCTIDRYVVSGDKISFGTACSAELNFKIRNQTFNYNGVEYDPNTIKFEGARVKVWCVFDDVNGSQQEIPMGVFTIDEQPRRLSTISLTALDDMVKLDNPCSLTTLPHRFTVVKSLEEETGVEVADDFGRLFLGGVYINCPKIENYGETEILLRSDEEEITWRQLMCWFAEIKGASLIINAEGKLDVLYFPTSAILDIDESMRYNSDVDESDISVTGVSVELSDGTVKTIGEDTYAYSISGNRLITDSADDVDDNNSTVNCMLPGSNVFVTYRPFNATIKSFPNLWPMDGVNYVKDGKSYFSILTHVTWTLNGAMSVESAGLNSTRNGYAKTKSLTNAERTIIERLNQNVNSKISDFEQAVIDLNDRVNESGKGLYYTELTDESGAKILYTHDMPSLEDSTYITMTTSAGFVFTRGVNCWNSGNPVWLYGYTDYGDMVMNTINSRKISTEQLSVGSYEKPVNVLPNGNFGKGLVHWNTGSIEPYSYTVELLDSGKPYLKLCPGDNKGAYVYSDKIYLPAGYYYVLAKGGCSANVDPRVVIKSYSAAGTLEGTMTVYTQMFNPLQDSDEMGSCSMLAKIYSPGGYFVMELLCMLAGTNSNSYAKFTDLMIMDIDNYRNVWPDETVPYTYVEYNNNGNIHITEDAITVYNGQIVIYKDALGVKPVFNVNEDGSLAISGNFRAEGIQYDMLCSNVIYSDNSIDVDSHGLYIVNSGETVPKSLTGIEGIPYIRFVDQEMDDLKKRNIEISSLNDINVISRNEDGVISLAAKQVLAGGVTLNCGAINCTGNLWISDSDNNFEGSVGETLVYLMDRYNKLWERVTG